MGDYFNCMCRVISQPHESEILDDRLAMFDFLWDDLHLTKAKRNWPGSPISGQDRLVGLDHGGQNHDRAKNKTSQ